MGVKDPEFTAEELQAIREAAEAARRRRLNGGDDPKNWREALPLLNISKWDGVPVPEQPYAVPGRVPIGFSTLFSGEGAAGKSTLQLQQAAAAAGAIG
jgi:hypothetical protein